MVATTRKSRKKGKAIGWERRKANIDTHQVILEEATRLFSQKGVETTSMRDIAGAVGITAASLYNHFGSKNEILYTVLYEAMEALAASCRQSIDEAADDPVDKLYQLVTRHITFQIAQLEAISMMDAQLFRASRMSRSLTDVQRNHLNGLQDEVVHLFRDVLDEGRKQGVMSFSDSTITAFGILGIIEHITYWYSPDGPVKGPELAESLASMALKSVEAQRTDH